MDPNYGYVCGNLQIVSGLRCCMKCPKGVIMNWRKLYHCLCLYFYVDVFYNKLAATALHTLLSVLFAAIFGCTACCSLIGQIQNSFPMVLCWHVANELLAFHLSSIDHDRLILRLILISLLILRLLIDSYMLLVFATLLSWLATCQLN